MCASLRFYSLFWKDGAIVNGMVLHYDVGKGDDSSRGVTAKVKDHLDTIGGVNAFQVSKVVNGFSGFEGNALCEEEDAVVTNVGELQGHARKIKVGVHNHGEVIVLVGREHNGGCGVDEELGLPLVCCCFGQGESVLTVLKGGFRICNLIPAGSIPVCKGMVLVSGKPEVAFCVVLEALECHRAGLGGKDEVPGDIAIVMYQLKNLAGCIQDLEFRFSPEAVVVDVRE